MAWFTVGTLKILCKGEVIFHPQRRERRDCSQESWKSLRDLKVCPDISVHYRSVLSDRTFSLMTVSLQGSSHGGYWARDMWLSVPWEVNFIFHLNVIDLNVNSHVLSCCVGQPSCRSTCELSLPFRCHQCQTSEDDGCLGKCTFQSPCMLHPSIQRSCSILLLLAPVFYL